MDLRVRRWIERITLCFLMCCALATSDAAAQACPAGKYCFYVPPGLPLEASHSGAASRAFDLVLSAPVRTVTGTYAIAGSAMASFSVSPGTSVRLPLPGTSGYASAYGVTEQNGVFLVADSPDLTVDHREVFDSEQYSETIKRHSIALGSRFRLGGYSLNRENRPQTGIDAVLIYAPSGGTITLTAPPGATLPFWADTGTATYTATLAAGQTIAVRTRVGADLDGGLLTSTQPVSVSTGGRGWSAGVCGDDGMDGLVPVSALGTQHVVRLPTGSSTNNNESRVRVIADVDGTEVRVNGTLAATLAAGAYHTFVPSALSYIETSQPVLVWMNGALNGCELDTVLIPPLAFAPALTSLSLDFNVLASNQEPAAELAILIATDDVDTILLDGQAPTFTANMTVPGRPELAYVRFNVAVGDRNVRAGSDFQAMLASRTQPSGLLAYYNPFRIPGCGDAGSDPGEACDDGNVEDNDGCSSTCQLEPGWTCSGAPSACAATCGDGQVALPIETCDDENPTAGDGCNSTCRAEVTISAPAEGTALTDPTPTITGTAEAGVLVTIRIGDVEGLATADAAGSWSFTVPTPLADGLRTVVASAVDGRNGSSSAMRMITIDTGTTLTIAAPVAGSVLPDLTPTFVGTGEAGSSVDVRIDGLSIGATTVLPDGSWALTPTMPLTSGPHDVSAVATDALNNMVATMAVRFTIDVATTVTVTMPAANDVVGNATPTIVGTAEPGAAIVVSVRDATGATITATGTAEADGSFRVTLGSPLANGVAELTASATDGAGNAASATVAFTVDATTFVRIETPAEGALLRTATPTLIIAAEPGASLLLRLDDLLLARGMVDLDGLIEIPLAAPLTDGIHTLVAEANDRGGAFAIERRTFRVDTRTEVDVQSPIGGTVLDSGAVTLSGTGEPGATVQLTIDGRPLGSATVDSDGRFTIVLTEPLADGSYDARVVITDAAGNDATRDVPFSVDTKPRAPRLEIFNPPQGSATRTEEPALTGIAEPNAHIIVVLDGIVLDAIRASASGSWSVQLITPLARGPHMVLVTSTDQLRVVAFDQVEFTIDTTMPDLRIQSPAQSSVIRDVQPPIEGTATANATVRVFVDDAAIGETVADGSGAWSVVTPLALAQGSHVARAVVAEGAALPASMAVGFHVDTETQVGIFRPTRDEVIGAPLPTLVGTAEAGDRLTLWIDGVEVGRTEATIVGTWQHRLTVPLGTGPHVLRVRAEDALGNEAFREQSFVHDLTVLDSDGDGRSDREECGESACPDSDGDGITDDLDEDDDGDGLPSASECTSAPCTDSDDDGRPDVLDQDDDNDMRSTYEERSDVGLPRDTDADGTPDHLDTDDDGDSSPTREECASTPCPDTDGNGLPNYLDPDDDGDQLPTARELADSEARGSDDDDGDGLVNWFDADANDNGVPDLLDGVIDGDGDGLPDYVDLDTIADNVTVSPSSGYNIAGGAGCSAGGRRGALDASTLALMGLALALARRRRRGA